MAGRVTQYRFISRQYVAIVLLGLFVLLGAIRAAGAQTVTQGYGADQPLQRGMIVSLKAKEPTKVEPASSKAISRVHGVVINANDAPVTITGETTKVFVATVGRYEVLVSNQKGAIKAADYITVSNVDGIGMKADGDQPIIIGKALGSFDGKQDVIGSQQVSGQAVTIGRITVDVGIAGNPLAKPKNRNVPSFLQTASDAIANKPVSAPRIYAALVVLAGTLVIVGAILYTGVHSSITSIGRNPLSRHSIARGLMQVIGASVIVLIVGIFGVYLLLKV